SNMKKKLIIAAALLLTACTSQPVRQGSETQDTVQTSEVITTEGTFSTEDMTTPEETASETTAQTGQNDLFISGDMTWQQGYRNFLLSGGYKTEDYGFSSRNEDTYFALIDLMQKDGENIPELVVFREGFCYSIYHWSEGDEETYPHVCRLMKLPYNGWSGMGINYLPGQDIVMYLEASRLAMHGFASYDLYVGDPEQNCFFDHVYEKVPYTVYINDDPELMSKEEYDEQREAVKQYGITNEGEEVMLDDNWAWLDQSSPDAHAINEANIDAAFGE
ncbi:MAG: hypothetical protein II695_05660, partial [Oscillospiraceae bacterium]|nr:hypothetical protein [Oscillospiraceae bacterium]